MAPWDFVKNRYFYKCLHKLLDLSARDLRNYWTESNDTLHTCRAGTLVVHLGIGFARRRKMAPWDFVKNWHFSKILTLMWGVLSARDLRKYWTDSNETLHTCRAGTLVVHLGIGFARRRKMAPWDFIKYFSKISALILKNRTFTRGSLNPGDFAGGGLGQCHWHTCYILFYEIQINNYFVFSFVLLFQYPLNKIWFDPPHNSRLLNLEKAILLRTTGFEKWKLD